MPVPQSASSSSLRGRQWRSSTNYAQALSSSSTSCGRPTLPGFQPRVPACQCVPPSSAVDLHIDTRTAQRQAPPRLALDDEPSSQFGSLGPVGHGGQLSLHPGGTHPEGEPASTFGQDRPPLPPNTEELDIIMVPSSPRACVTVLLQQDLNSPSGPARYLTDSSSSDSDADTAWQEPLDQNLQTVLQLSTAGMLAASAYQHMPECQDCLEALTSPGATSAAGLQPPTLGPAAGTESVIAAAAAAAATSMLPLPVGSTSSNSSSSSSSTATPGSSTPSLGMPITTAAAALTTAITTATIASGSSSSSSSSSAAPASEQGQEHVCSPAKLWALGLLAACYVHQASTSFSIPVMLPMVSSSLHLTDLEGAMLTTGYSYLYALALVPMGMLVDRVSARPALLGTAVAVWSGLTMVAAQANSFSELMAARVGLAAAQSAQNVVCFGMIPELFPTTRSTAMAFYNCAIYLGRGLMYLVTNAARELLSHQPAAIDAASQALIQYDAYGNILVPLDKLDLRLAQLVYTIGDMAAIRATAPLYELSQAATGLEDSAWRQVLEQLAVPGLFISAALLLTVRETRKASKSDSSSSAASGPQAQPGADAASNSAITATAADAVVPASTSRPGQQERSGPLGWLSRLWHKQQGVASAALPGPDAAAQAPAAAAATSSSSSSSSGKASVWSLASNKPFLTITAAAALNDFGSYAFIGWQSTFYERAYHLEITQYAPVLATILPLAGIIGGVGGGLLADRLSKSGKRYWVTVATSLMAAPLLWASLTADTAEHSFLYLGLGFALSEGWRAPAAVMCRGVAPPEISSTAISLYLCLRNLLGGLGPLMIAHVATGVDLQLALQLLPPVYFASGLLFWAAESQIAAASAAADKTLAAQSTSTSGSSGVSSSMDASAVAGAHTGGVAGALARSIGMEGAAAALASRDEWHAGTSGPDAASGAAAAGTTAVTAGAPQPVPIPLPVAPEQQKVQVPTRV